MAKFCLIITFSLLVMATELGPYVYEDEFSQEITALEAVINNTCIYRTISCELIVDKMTTIM